MILPNDMSSDWSEQDIALYASVVGAIITAVKDTVIKHGRIDDPVLHLVSRAQLTAIKSMMIEVGLRDDRTSLKAFNAYASLLATEVANISEQARVFENSLTVHGRA